MENKVKDLIIKTLQSSADEYEIKELKTADENTKLYNGFGGYLDSLALVSLVEVIYRNNEEYIKIIGRNKEVINVGGEKVVPQEVENILMQIPYYTRLSCVWAE